MLNELLHMPLDWDWDATVLALNLKELKDDLLNAKLR
jgi:hypothetical protein